MIRHPTSHGHKPRRNDDGGAVLALVLVFLTVTAVILSVTLGLINVNLKTTTVVQSRTDRGYTTDAAIEQAIQLVTVDPTKCTSGETLPPQTLNDRTATASCTVIDGGGFPVGGAGWAAIINGNLDKSNGGFARLSGPIYVKGTISASGKAIVDDGGSVYQYSPACPGSLTAPPIGVLEVKPTPPYRWQCTSAAAADPKHILPPMPSTVNPVPGGNGACRIFYPGRYTSAPALATKNYFVSGRYYFDNVGTWGGNQIVGGNNPADPTVLASQISPCVANPAATDATQGKNGSGFGVQWIMGGNSRIALATGDRVLLHTRVPGPDEPNATPGVSFQAVTTDQASGGYTISNPGAPLLDAGGGQPLFSSFGLTYAPASDLILGGPVGTSVLQNGVVVRNLTIKLAAASDDTEIIGLGTSASGKRIVEITAVATSSGEATVVSRAVVEIRNTTSPPTVVIKSWRTTSGGP